MDLQLRAERLDPIEAAISDCNTLVSEGADPADLARTDQLGADEALINAMGRAWIIRAAGGTEDTDEAWDQIGIPWCAAYSKAHRDHAASLVDEQAVRS